MLQILNLGKQTLTIKLVLNKIKKKKGLYGLLVEWSDF